MALIYISIALLRPFWIPIVAAFIIAFIFYPLYEKILKKTKRPNLSSLATALVIILIIIIPVIVVINSAGRELLDVYSYVSVKMSEEEKLISIECIKDNLLCKAINIINTNPQIRFYASGAVVNMASYFTKTKSEYLFTIPKKVLDIFVIFVLVFFLLKGGKSIWNRLRELLPLKESHKDKLLKRFTETVDGVVFGYLVVSVIEGLVGWLAFTIIGFKAAVIMGILILISALLPMIGASLIWLPVAIVYFLTGFPGKTAVLLIAGFIIALLDSWTRAQIIGDKVKIHPAVVLLGVLGGIATMGIVGMILGPLILSLLITSLDIYEDEKDSFLV